METPVLPPKYSFLSLLKTCHREDQASHDPRPSRDKAYFLPASWLIKKDFLVKPCWRTQKVTHGRKGLWGWSNPTGCTTISQHRRTNNKISTTKEGYGWAWNLTTMIVMKVIEKVLFWSVSNIELHIVILYSLTGEEWFYYRLLYSLRSNCVFPTCVDLNTVTPFLYRRLTAKLTQMSTIPQHIHTTFGLLQLLLALSYAQ